MQQADTATTPKEKVARARGVVLFARLKAVSQVESSILMVSVIRLDGASLLRNVTALLVSLFLPLGICKCENIVQQFVPSLLILLVRLEQAVLNRTLTPGSNDG